METLTLFFFFFFFISFFTYTALSATNCSPSSCGLLGPEVRFPFRLRNVQNDRCGYPGFDLSCKNHNQTIINLPRAGEFIVKRIDYTTRTIDINDPDYCLPNRIQNFSLYDSPFSESSSPWSWNFTFLNCSSDWGDYVNRRSIPVYCLSTNHHNYTVVATTVDDFVPPMCRYMWAASFPMQWDSVDRAEDLQLTWSTSSCEACEEKGGTCDFKGDTQRIECVNLPSNGLPRSAKYGIIIGGGIPGFVCLIGLVCCLGSRIRNYGRRRQLDLERTNPEFTLQLAATVTGLDGPTIESYPKTVLGESGRLPKPSDGTCPICLAEYQPKETLRTIPECNHYFHATCIDEWLSMNATCPLCRNSPDGSSVMTPCSSMSLSSSSLLSSSS